MYTKSGAVIETLNVALGVRTCEEAKGGGAINDSLPVTVGACTHHFQILANEGGRELARCSEIDQVYAVGGLVKQEVAPARMGNKEDGKVERGGGGH